VPIKWNALKVSQAMDEVETQLDLAESFLAEAEAKARRAKTIPKLPQYLDQRLNRLIDTIERRQSMRYAIEGVHKAIPEGAIETEREKAKYGSQQSLI